MSKPKQRVIEYRNYKLPFDFPVLLLQGDRWHISDKKSDVLHIHNCLEIGICHTDSGTLEYGDSCCNFTAGDITCISQNIPHTTYSAKGSASLWSYLFLQPEELIKNYLSDYPLIAKKIVELDQKYFSIIHKDDAPEIYQLVIQIINELTRKEEDYQMSVAGLFVSLFIRLLRIGSADISATNTEYSKKAIVLSPALDYIHQNYAQQFSIELLAQLCHLSSTHFRRIFQTILNTSPLDYLNTYRILKACNLLRSTEDSVLGISEQVGFCSISSFNRHFCAIMGTSPSKWRQSSIETEHISILEYNGWLDDTPHDI